MSFCDAHCHLANLDGLIPIQPILDDAQQTSITKYFTTALTRSEADLQASWSDPRLILGAGVHPNFDECDLTVEDIRAYCDKGSILAVGEIGYDRNGAQLTAQLALLEAQLAIAMEYDLPAVLHLVGLPQPVLDMLKSFPLRYLVHGFAGKVNQFDQLSHLNAWFTISERIAKPDKSDLLCAMVGSKRYLFETDITRYYVLPGEANPLLRLNSLVVTTSENCHVPVQDLERVQAESLFDLAGVTLD